MDDAFSVAAAAISAGWHQEEAAVALVELVDNHRAAFEVPHQ
jgi:hypothetical protein